MKSLLLLLLVTSPIFSAYMYESGYRWQREFSGVGTLKFTLRDLNSDPASVKIAVSASKPSSGDLCYFIAWGLNEPNDWKKGDVLFFGVNNAQTAYTGGSSIKDGYFKDSAGATDLIISDDGQSWTIGSEGIETASKIDGNNLIFEASRTFAAPNADKDQKINKWMEGGIKVIAWVEATTCPTVDTSAKTYPGSADVATWNDFYAPPPYDPTYLFKESRIQNMEFKISGVVSVAFALLASIAVLLN